MREDRRALPLHQVTLPDARTGDPVALGDLAGVRVLTLLRHRH
ncbi:MAG: hypothetical protein ACT4RN_10115 [Pseudonocardia sp.]